MSKPKTDLADALPILSTTDIITVGLLNFSFSLDATIPIIPLCQLCPDKTITGSLLLSVIFFSILFSSIIELLYKVYRDYEYNNSNST